MDCICKFSSSLKVPKRGINPNEQIRTMPEICRVAKKPDVRFALRIHGERQKTLDRKTTHTSFSFIAVTRIKFVSGKKVSVEGEWCRYLLQYSAPD